MGREDRAGHGGEIQDAVHLAERSRVDEAWREGLEKISRLACQILQVPVAQVNVVLSGRQHSLSSVAEEPEWASWNGPRDVPVDSSYCRYVIQSGDPLTIEDARNHPLVKDHPATIDSGIGSYAAVPLKNEEGKAFATLCVVDFEARPWSASDLAALSALADFLLREIRLRIRAEEELQEGTARFRALVDDTDDLITIADLEATVTYQSPAYGRILGYGRTEIEGTLFPELIHPEDVAGWSEHFFADLREPKARASAKWRMRHRDGSWRTVEGTGVNLVHEPAVRGIVFNIKDVTKEKQIEAELHQAQKMEAVGRLAGGVAHDYNNLITAITGCAAFLLSRGDLSPEADQDVREIQDVVQRASRLTEQLLTFSRDQPVRMEGLDLGTVVEDSVPLVKRLLGANVSLETDFARDLPILADAGRIGQLVMNLAVNGRDAMPDGGTLSIETRPVTLEQDQAGSHSDIQSGRYAMLVVADDGVGMSRAVQEQIFDPFFTTKPAGKGTGLGLSMCWGIASQMGGHIHVYSEPGEGTAFRVYFPWAETGISDAGRPEPPEDEFERAAAATIMIVEDDPAIRRIMRKVLKADGHEVIEAETSEAALEMARSLGTAPDLVLTDVFLPGMSGAALVARLRAEGGEFPVLYTSGFTHGELSDQNLEMSDAAFLPKPFGPDELSKAVAGALRRIPT